MPISGNSYYDDNQVSGAKKKPFFKAYLDALRAGKQALDGAESPAPPEPTVVSPPIMAPVAPPAAYAAPVAVAEPAAYAPPPAIATPAAIAPPVAPAAMQAPPARRAAKRRRASTDAVEAMTPTASMDAMMQHILELAQKVEAAASKVEAVADKAEASARPAAEDGVMVPARTTFSRPAPHHSGAYSGSAIPVELPSIAATAADTGFQASASPVAGQFGRRGASLEEADRDTAASGLVTLDHEMSIPKVAPYILDKGSDSSVSPSILEIRPVENAAPELLLTKTSDEPRPQGAPIVLRSQNTKEARAINESR